MRAIPFTSRRIQLAAACGIAAGSLALPSFEGNKRMDVEQARQLLAPLFPGSMGITLLELSPERVVAEMRVRADLCTTGGVLHGGASMAFADTLGALGTMQSLPPGATTTTTDSSTKFIAPAKVGSTVRAESVALHRGRTTMVWQTSIRNENGRLCALVTQTQLVLAPRSASLPC